MKSTDTCIVGVHYVITQNNRGIQLVSNNLGACAHFRVMELSLVAATAVPHVFDALQGLWPIDVRFSCRLIVGSL